MPEDIKDDLLERAEENKDQAKENYRSSLYSSKLEETEELIELKTRLEADLEELERRLNTNEDLSLPGDIELFGSNFLKLSKPPSCQ